jgi:hypothetical protein
VTPSTTIAYTVDGGSQPAGGADVLRLVPAQAGAAANGTTITIPGDKAVAYQHIEELFPGTADTSKKGSWKGAYGGDGYNIIGDLAKLPAYAKVSPSGQATLVWSASTTDTRALQKADPGATDRIAAAWSGTQFTVDINLTDGLVHKVSMYAVDWDSTLRSERVDIVSAATGAVLDSRTLSSFHNGTYLTWYLSGHVRLRLTKLAGTSAVLSGLFFDGSSSSASGLSATIHGGNSIAGGATSPSGLAAPILVLTPEELDSALRTTELRDRANPFERLLGEIAALRVRSLAASPSSPSIAVPAPFITAPPPQKSGSEQHRGARTAISLARANDPVENEPSSQLMALDPTSFKPKPNRLFS